MEDDMHLGAERSSEDSEGICNMSWTESEECILDTMSPRGNNNSFETRLLKRRFGMCSESGYLTFESSSGSRASMLDEEEFLTMERENEFLENEDFQKLITGKIIKPHEDEHCSEAKKMRILNSNHQQQDFEISVKDALAKLDNEPDLIGDFSKPHVLPTINGRHQDLKSISPMILYDLLNGKYNDRIDSFQVLDCRFPYEYQGGHIKGAENVYSKKQILDLLDVQIKMNQTHIIIFHCEFSSERGPKLARFLRSKDRENNASVYPKLQFPEIYLLDGGYRDYYSQFPTTCVPQEYLPMLHPDYSVELRHFRAKSKSENSNKQRASLRPRSLKIKSSQF